MSMRFIISGDDLDYLKTVVQQALSGEYGGDFDEVRIVARDTGLIFGVNGYVTDDLGSLIVDEIHSLP